MRVLITGASGFIGSRLAYQLLNDDHNITALVHPSDSLHRLDSFLSSLRLTEADLHQHSEINRIINDVQPDIVIHLAWYPAGPERWSSPANLDALYDSINLIHAVGKSGCKRFIGIGTCVEYDVSTGYLSEQSLLRPHTMYGASKLSLFYALEQLSRVYDLDFSWLRIFYLYGPGEDSDRLVAYIINQLLDDQPASLTAGQQIRDYLHVDDVASAIWTVASSSFRGAVNIGSGQPVSVARMATTIGAIMQKPSLVKLGDRTDRPGDPEFICANNAQLRQLGWQPHYGLESGLQQTINWWHNQSKGVS